MLGVALPKSDCELDGAFEFESADCGEHGEPPFCRDRDGCCNNSNEPEDVEFVGFDSF